MTAPEITREAIEQAMQNDHAATSMVLAERWLVDHPDDLSVAYKYARMLYLMGRHDDAVRILEEFTVRLPKAKWLVLNELGHLNQYRGDLISAEAAFVGAISERPSDAGSYIFLGAVQARKGELAAAEATHRKAILCAEGDIDEAYHNLGLVLRGQGRLAEAKECFAKALELCPDYKAALVAHVDVTQALNILENSSSDAEVS